MRKRTAPPSRSFAFLLITSIWQNVSAWFVNCRSAEQQRYSCVEGSAPPSRGLRLPWRFALPAVCWLALTSSLPAVTQIVAYVDPSGHRVYVSENDGELRAAVRRGGVAAGVLLVSQRRQSLAWLDPFIESESRSRAVDPQLVRSIIEVESAWNPDARSRKGALGLMQLLPETGARFGVQHFFEPKENVGGGIRYLRFLLDRFGGNLEWTLAAYNAGESAVDSKNGIPPYPETREYVRLVQARYRQRTSRADGPPEIHAVEDHGTLVFMNY